MHIKVTICWGRASSIEKVSAYNASNPSSITDEASLVLVAIKMSNLDSSNFLIKRYENWIRKRGFQLSLLSKRDMQPEQIGHMVHLLRGGRINAILIYYATLRKPPLATQDNILHAYLPELAGYFCNLGAYVIKITNV